MMPLSQGDKSVESKGLFDDLCREMFRSVGKREKEKKQQHFCVTHRSLVLGIISLHMFCGKAVSFYHRLPQQVNTRRPSVSDGVPRAMQHAGPCYLFSFCFFLPVFMVHH